MALELKGIESGGFAGYGLTDHLLYHLKWWLDLGLLYHGGFAPVTFTSSSAIDAEEARLHCVQDERYEYGRVWEGYGREWAWESGVNVASPPFRASGVYVEAEFHPVDQSGVYAHHIDFRFGRVLFDHPQDPQADIRAEYCYRSVFVASADSPLYRELLVNSLEDFADQPEPSGMLSREHQIWLPAIFVDVVGGTGRGLELGGGQIKSRNVVLHVFADRDSDRNLLMDWLDYQSRSTFIMADLNSATLPFDAYGGIVPGVTNWVDMANAYPWRKIRFVQSAMRKVNSVNPKLFRGRVEYDAEIDCPGI